MSRAVYLAVSLSLLCAGCHGEDIDAMERQRKLLPYASIDAGAGASTMRAPPEGAIPRERALSPREAPPMSLTLLELGRARFDRVCAACHGLAGDGDSVAATKMSLRPPPSLHEPRIQAMDDLALYDVVTDGYGLMPSMAVHLSPEERWAVVGYVRALEESQHTAFEDAPDDVRRTLEAAP